MCNRGEGSQGARLGSTAGPDPNRNPHTTPVLAITWCAPESPSPPVSPPGTPEAPGLRQCRAVPPAAPGRRAAGGARGTPEPPARLGSARPPPAARQRRHKPSQYFGSSAEWQFKRTRRAFNRARAEQWGAHKGRLCRSRPRRRRGLPAPPARAGSAASRREPAPGSPRCAAARLHDAAGTGAAAPAPEVSTKPGYIKFNYNTWLSCNAFYLQISKCFLSIKQASQCPLPSSCGRVCYTLSLFILNAVRRN